MYKFSDAWKVDDKAWLKERQLRWKQQVLPRLKHMVKYQRIIYKRDLPYLKAFFLKGTLLPYDAEWSSRASIYKDDLGKPYRPRFIFKIWFHPEENEQVFRDIMDDHYHNNPEQLYHDRLKYVYLNSYSLGKDQDYEFLAGRNYYLDRILLPKTWEEYIGPKPETVNWSRDYDDSVDEWQEKKSEKEEFFIHLLTQMNSTRTARTTSFSFDLFVDLARQVDIYKNCDGETAEQMLKFVMNRILYLKGKKYTPKLNPELMAIWRAEITELFNNGITPEIDALWVQCKEAKFTNIVD